MRRVLVAAILCAFVSSCSSDTESRAKKRSDGTSDGTGADNTKTDEQDNDNVDTGTPVSAEKIGINFENDSQSATPDFQDSLICVEGKLELLESSKKISITQDSFDVKFTFKNPSSCTHTFSISKKSASGTVLATHEQVDTMGATAELSFAASKGEVVELTLKSKDCSTTVSELNLAHTSTWSKVKANSCD